MRREFPERPIQRIHFNRIAQFSPGPVRFNIGNAVRGNIRPTIGINQQTSLRFRVGGSEKMRSPTVILSADANDRENVIAICFGLMERLEQDRANALALDVTVGVLIKSLATPIRRQHPQLTGHDKRFRSQQQMCATGNRHFTIAIPQRPHRPMHRNQGAGTGGINGLAGAVPVQQERNPIRQHRRGTTQHRLRLSLARITDQTQIFMQLAAHEHTHIPACQRAGPITGILQRRPNCFQKQPMLRVQEHRFTRRNAKQRRIEPVNIGHKPAPVRHRAFRIGQMCAFQRPPIPALRRHLGNQVIASEQVLPEGVQIRRLRKAPGHPDNRNSVIGQSRCLPLFLANNLSLFPSLAKEGWRNAPGWFVPRHHQSRQIIRQRRNIVVFKQHGWRQAQLIMLTQLFRQLLHIQRIQPESSQTGLRIELRRRQFHHRRNLLRNLINQRRPSRRVNNGNCRS